jgi:hypothetical protein
MVRPDKKASAETFQVKRAKDSQDVQSALPPDLK